MRSNKYNEKQLKKQNQNSKIQSIHNNLQSNMSSGGVNVKYENQQQKTVGEHHMH